MPTKPTSIKEIVTMLESFDDAEQILINLHLGEKDEHTKKLRYGQRQHYRLAINQLLGYLGMTQEVITDAYQALERVDTELDTLTRHLFRCVSENKILHKVVKAEPKDLRQFIDPLLLDTVRSRSYDQRSSDVVASKILEEITRVFSEPAKLNSVLMLVHSNDRSPASAVRQIRAGYVGEIRTASLLEALARFMLVSYRRTDTDWQRHWREFAKTLTYAIPDAESEDA